MRKFLCIAFALALFAGNAMAQTDLRANIAKLYTRFMADEQLSHATVSLTVLDAASGQTVFSQNGNLGLATASTLKTITAATALHVLGPNFRYETMLAHTGSLTKEGVLNGDILIIGSGDPSLGSWRFEQTGMSTILNHWLAAIQQAGIKQINGRVIGYDALFGTQITPDGWIWQDIGNYYGGGASALSWHENQFDVYLSPGAQVGDAVAIKKVDPGYSNLTFVNEVRTGPKGSGDKVYAYAAPFTDVIYLRGTYAIDLVKPVSPAIPDPALAAATRLSDTLKSVGIAQGQAPSTWRKIQENTPYRLPAYQLLHRTLSPKLSELVFWFNRKSINLYGENLLKTLALQQGKAADTQQGAAFVKAFWKQKLGIDPAALTLYDGSGLSPANRVSTLAMAQILRSLRSEPWFAPYYESLPLYNSMKMKSGSIADVLAYTGYHKTSLGQELVFSFITNNYNGSTAEVKRKMFEVLDALK